MLAGQLGGPFGPARAQTMIGGSRMTAAGVSVSWNRKLPGGAGNVPPAGVVT